MSFQLVVIQGNLTRKPELRQTPAGKAVTDITVAVNEGYGNRKQTLWYKVTLWEKQAENACQYLDRGREVTVVGSMQADESGNPRVFQKRDGSWAAMYEMRCREIHYGGRGNSQSDAGDSDPADWPTEESRIPF